jgi:DNA-binding response OmpR family regulator
MKAKNMDTERILSGKLRKGTLEYLLKKAHNNGLTGKLSVNGREGFGVIVLKDGKIISASWPAMKNMLAESLIEKGILADDQAYLVLDNLKKTSRKQLETILQESSKEDIHEILIELSQDALFGMLMWDGVYRFEQTSPEDIPFEMSIDINDFFRKIDTSIDDIDIDIEMEAIGRESEPDKVSNYKEEINDTIKDVAKSLTTFKTHERVIVVEDETLMRTMIVDGLLNFGFEVEEYDNARDATTRIQELDMTRICPAVVLDLMMAGLYDANDVYGGIDLLSYICRSYPSVPVIIATGIDDPNIKLHSCFLGSSYFINKPDKRKMGPDDFRSHVDLFIEELSFNLENIFRKQQAYLEKEQLVSIREELLAEFIKKGLSPVKDEAKILGARILLVDDEVEICNLGKEFLNNEGFVHVDIATDGKEAIKRFTEKKHDVVVSDIVMPKKNGIELLRYIKILSPNSQVIMITGYAEKRSAIASIKLGAFDFIEKPIDFRTLPQIIRKAIELKFMLDDKHWAQ